MKYKIVDKITRNSLDTQIGGQHYQFNIQPIEFITLNNLDFIQGNIIKYACRLNKKENTLQDIEKIKHYCELYIDLHKLNSDKLYLEINRSDIYFTTIEKFLIINNISDVKIAELVELSTNFFLNNRLCEKLILEFEK